MNKPSNLNIDRNERKISCCLFVRVTNFGHFAVSDVLCPERIKIFYLERDKGKEVGRDIFSLSKGN